MRHSSTLDVGLDVHKESIAGAYAPEERGPEVVCHGTIGTRQCDIDKLIRPLSSTAQQLVCVYDAGPCGSWLDRYLSCTTLLGGVVAPALVPTNAGDRVNTDAQQSVFQEYGRAVAEHQARLQRLEAALREQVQTWRLSPVVQALQAMRGIPVTVAVTLSTALGDLPRVENPRPLMSSLGLNPRESARGARRRQGSITNAGHTFARRALIAGAWACRYPAQGRRHLQLRLEPRPQAIQNIGWQAQVRLCMRFRHLTARGKPANQVVVAIARELAACIGAIAREVPMARSTSRPFMVHGHALER